MTKGNKTSRFRHAVFALAASMALSGCACLCGVQKSAAGADSAAATAENDCVVKDPSDRFDEKTFAFLGARVFAYDCLIPKGVGCITWCETTVDSKTILSASEYMFAADKDGKAQPHLMPVALIRYDPDVMSGTESARGMIDLSLNSTGGLAGNKLLMDEYPLKKITALSEKKCLDFPVKCELRKVYRLYELKADTGRGRGKKVCVTAYCAFFPQEDFNYPAGGGYFDGYGQFGQVLSRNAADLISKSMER